MIEIIKIVSYLLMAHAIFYYIRRNDEFPGLIIAFFYFTGLFRYNALQSGRADYVNVAYRFDIFVMTPYKAELALGYFFLGTLLFYLFYVLFRRHKHPSQPSIDNSELFTAFLKSKSFFIITLFVLFLIINSWFRGMIRGAVSYGNSYFVLFSMALGGMILLMFVLFLRTKFTQNSVLKLVILGLIVYSASLSYTTSMRFRFLSWSIGLGIIYLQDRTSIQKLKYFAIGGVIVLTVFSLAGVERQVNIQRLTFNEKVTAAWDRMSGATDQNMLDGFMMVLDVYPEYLDYHKGGEHLEILYRPIPRRLWVGKPVGGYANKLGLNDYENSGTVGISQTLYGSFYGEGGVAGIVIFSFLYAMLFVWAFKYSERYNSDMRWILRAVIIGWAIPLLRGGDLPGIYAWLGMTYWPVFIILWQYNRFLKTIPVKSKQEMNESTVALG